MLMRYLFLDTAMCGEYVPVLVELRRISNQSIGHLSILELIYTCLKEFDVHLPEEQFEYSLQLGKYLFLFDGLDEVKTSLATETAKALQIFSAKYPKNPCIITSRPREESSPLETFIIMEISFKRSYTPEYCVINFDKSGQLIFPILHNVVN